MPDAALPTHATPASHTRLALAAQLAQHCPTTLASAITLTGSSARGLAEPGSDAEVVFWADALPALDARADWLLSAGVTALQAEAGPRSDESEWFEGTFSGIPFEFGWQTFDALEASLAPLRDGLTTDRGHMRFGELLASALVLRPEPRLLALQREMALFPDALRDHLLAELSGHLTGTERWAKLRTLAQRGEQISVVQGVAAQMQAAVRYLYALHRRWEAGDKWLLTLAADLPGLPTHWRDGINAILTAPPEDAVALAQAWCDEVLSANLAP